MFRALEGIGKGVGEARVNKCVFLYLAALRRAHLPVPPAEASNLFASLPISEPVPSSPNVRFVLNRLAEQVTTLNAALVLEALKKSASLSSFVARALLILSRSCS